MSAVGVIVSRLLPMRPYACCPYRCCWTDSIELIQGGLGSVIAGAVPCAAPRNAGAAGLLLIPLFPCVLKLAKYTSTERYKVQHNNSLQHYLPNVAYTMRGVFRLRLLFPDRALTVVTDRTVGGSGVIP